MASTSLSSDGKFQVERLPPAAYFAFAVLPLTDGECAEPDQLERTAAHATRFAIGAGQSINVALRLQDR